jgi:hypothetical protein
MKETPKVIITKELLEAIKKGSPVPLKGRPLKESPYLKLQSGEILAYGHLFPAGTDPGTIELWMFAHAD